MNEYSRYPKPDHRGVVQKGLEGGPPGGHCLFWAGLTGGSGSAGRGCCELERELRIGGLLRHAQPPTHELTLTF